MPRVHSVAERGFGAVADVYERVRPGYPPEVVRLLADESGLDASKTVVDLGAGTGKFTRELVTTGARVIAVEPVAEMRAQLEAAVPGAQALAGTAEEIPLADASADVVTAATAFHWFRLDRALPEIHRVLRPGGALAIVWNTRDESRRWVADVRRVLEAAVQTHLPPADVAEAVRLMEDWRAAFAATGLFTPPEEHEFRHEHEATVEDHVARFLSVSFVAALPDVERERVLADIERILRTDPETRGHDRFGLPYITEVYLSRRRP